MQWAKGVHHKITEFLSLVEGILCETDVQQTVHKLSLVHGYKACILGCGDVYNDSGWSPTEIGSTMNYETFVLIVVTLSDNTGFEDGLISFRILDLENQSGGVDVRIFFKFRFLKKLSRHRYRWDLSFPFSWHFQTWGVCNVYPMDSKSQWYSARISQGERAR